MRAILLAVCILFLALLIFWGRDAWQTRRSVLERLNTDPEDRVASARARCEEKLRELCREQAVTYPPRQLFLRAFKAEKELEAWARHDQGSFKRVATWPVLAASGQPGPKRREGDKQVPEGCYRVAVFNPKSQFHLSIGLDYPNDSDRVRSDPTAPGSDIYIHGGAVSIGCLAIGDDAIEELYLLAHDTLERPISVHIFPSRMSGLTWEKLHAAHPQHASLWAELAPIYVAFERTRQVPDVVVASNGQYLLR